MSNKTRDPSTLESLSRREAIGKLGVTAAAIAGVIPGTMLFSREVAAADKVKVGILHSLSGTIAIAEKSVVDAEMLAIEQVNKAGGVMGKLIEPVIEDGASDWPTYASCSKKTKLQR
jgi:urea transport system substrate-binding protein